MAKINIDNRPKEKMQLTIEFADNGIILRNPECEDEITLALTRPGTGDNLHDDEYKAIGEKVYECLMDAVVDNYHEFYIATGADLEITAALNGRYRDINKNVRATTDISTK